MHLRTCILLFLTTALSGCSGCPRRGDDPLTVTGAAVTLPESVPPEPVKVVPLPAPPSTPSTPLTPTGPAVEAAPHADSLATLARSGTPPVPPGAYVADDLTQRLKEKMAEAYEGDLTKVPDAKIYLGQQDLDSFARFYEQRGYKTQRVTIPASQIIQAAMRDRRDLVDRITLSDYDGVVIEQIIVEGTGVSAANKYIDPDTLRVIDRLFVTVMPLR